jgi:hypothetical protein
MLPKCSLKIARSKHFNSAFYFYFSVRFRYPFSLMKHFNKQGIWIYKICLLNMIKSTLFVTHLTFLLSFYISSNHLLHLMRNWTPGRKTYFARFSLTQRARPQLYDEELELVLMLGFFIFYYSWYNWLHVLISDIN